MSFFKKQGAGSLQIQVRNKWLFHPKDLSSEVPDPLEEEDFSDYSSPEVIKKGHL